jgi:LacI family kdg operon repressor
MKRVRIKDIAAEAGVSEATVSRFLNGNYKEMSAKTRERVREVIEKNDYRPNNFARGLKSHKSRLIGVIIADIENPFSSEMIARLTDQYRFSDYSLMISVTGNDGAAEEKAIQRCLDNGVDGLLINTTGANRDLILEAERRLPVVLLDRDISNCSLDLVTSNNAELMASLVSELARSGFENLLLLTQEPSTSAVRRIRMESFEDSLKRFGLSGRTVTIGGRGEKDKQKIREILHEAVEKNRSMPTAVIAINALMMLDIAECIDDSMQVGRDFGLATFDENPWNKLIFGGITTVRQDCAAAAETIHRRFNERIDSDKPIPTAKIMIPGELILRASTVRK